MTSDDLRRLFLGPTLFRLDTVIAPKLVPVLYATGLVAILVWAINQLFSAFGAGFGNGLWGLVEIAVFGTLWLLLLRAVCEAILVYFRAHEGAVESVRASRLPTTLLEDVSEAIHDLAEDETARAVTIREPVPTVPHPVSPAPPPPSPPAPARPVRRTARRTPPAAPQAPEAARPLETTKLPDPPPPVDDI